ncbi:MAG: hypothetical protein O3B95_05360 [Chloroflexi bacterium]|nr:hypothetical protein [Chloroflexota bacterium]
MRRPIEFTLNGPISIAMGFSELSKETIDNAGQSDLSSAEVSKIRGYLDMIETASLRARKLSRGIWNFAKLQPGTTEDINVVDVMQTVQLLTAPALKVEQIDVIRRGDSAETDVAMSFSDAALCQLILVELILNAPQSIPGGGDVIWQVEQTRDGPVGIELVAKPWNDSATREWEIPESVRESFMNMGGGIENSVPTPVSSSDGETDRELTGWKILATLPAPSSE